MVTLSLCLVTLFPCPNIVLIFGKTQIFCKNRIFGINRIFGTLTEYSVQTLVQLTISEWIRLIQSLPKMWTEWWIITQNCLWVLTHHSNKSLFFKTLLDMILGWLPKNLKNLTKQKFLCSIFFKLSHCCVLDKGKLTCFRKYLA